MTLIVLICCSGATHNRCHPGVDDASGPCSCRRRWCWTSSLCHWGKTTTFITHVMKSISFHVFLICEDLRLSSWVVQWEISKACRSSRPSDSSSLKWKKRISVTFTSVWCHRWALVQTHITWCQTACVRISDRPSLMFSPAQQENRRPSPPRTAWESSEDWDCHLIWWDLIRTYLLHPDQSQHCNNFLKVDMSSSLIHCLGMEQKSGALNVV